MDGEKTVSVHEQVFSPPKPAPVDNKEPLARDLLIAKARAYKEKVAHQSKKNHSKQLSMPIEDQEVEDKLLDVPLNQDDLDVPTYLRRQQFTKDD